MEVDLILTVPNGVLSLNSDPYKLASDSFATESVTFRRTEVSNPHLEGTYLVNALRENVTTQVSVWVTGATRDELVPALRTLCDAFGQVRFNAQLVVDGHSQIWSCYASDYVVSTQREFMHASRAKIDVNLIRDPHEQEF